MVDVPPKVQPRDKLSEGVLVPMDFDLELFPLFYVVNYFDVLVYVSDLADWLLLPLDRDLLATSEIRLLILRLWI